MPENDVSKIQSVVYEMPNLGVNVIPYDDSKSIRDFMNEHPDSHHMVFSARSIEEIANIYDKILAWISPERKLSLDELNSNISELTEYLQEKLISEKRYELIDSLLTGISQKS